MNVALDTMANLIEGIGKILPNCLRTNSGILHCSETDRDRSSNVQIELTNNSNGRLFIRQSFFYAGRLYGGALLLIGERWVPLVSDGFSLASNRWLLGVSRKSGLSWIFFRLCNWRHNRALIISWQIISDVIVRFCALYRLFPSTAVCYVTVWFRTEQVSTLWKDRSSCD